MLNKQSHALALLIGLCAACGGDDDADDDLADGGRRPDAGTGTDASTDAGLDGAAPSTVGDTLQPGSYMVSDVKSITDGCEMDLDDGEFTMQDLFNNGTVISIGTFRTPTSSPTSWTPEGYALGSGPWLTARTTTLTVSTHEKFTDTGVTCEFDTARTSKITYTERNTVTVDFTNVQSNPSAGCLTFGYPAGTCTSNFTFKLSKPFVP